MLLKLPALFLILYWLSVCDITHWGCPPGQRPSRGSPASSNTPRSNGAPAPAGGALWSHADLFYHPADCERCCAMRPTPALEPLYCHESYLANKRQATCYLGNGTNINRWVNKLSVADKDKNFVYLATGSPCRCRAAAGWAAADSRTDAWRCTSPVSSTWRGASATCRLYRESPTWTEDCTPSPPAQGDTVSLTFYSVHHLPPYGATQSRLFFVLCFGGGLRGFIAVLLGKLLTLVPRWLVIRRGTE